MEFLCTAAGSGKDGVNVKSKESAIFIYLSLLFEEFRVRF